MNTANKTKSLFLFDVFLVLVLLAGGYLRVIGLDWDQGQHLHPDERFLTMVETAIMPIGTPQEQLGPPPTAANQPWREVYKETLKDCTTWGGYFDTACSSLNPNNRGFSFYVYGTLPIFIVRYVAEWVSQTGYDVVQLVGRQLSALADLITILLLYVIAAKIYNRKVALLAAVFSTLAVLQIQLSHFFTVETYTNLFMYLAIYFAVRIATADHLPDFGLPPQGVSAFKFYASTFYKESLLWETVGFALAYGMAMASKVNAFPLAILLPIAFVVLYYRIPATPGSVLITQPNEVEEAQESSDTAPPIGNRSFDPISNIVTLLIIGGLISFLAFRVFQPYAFRGEFGFFDIRLNPAWLNTLREQRAQASGNVDFPPALQWANRSVLFSGQNMVLWGLGIPVGLLAFAGMLLMAWRMLRGEWKTHLLLWGWTAFYFAWQSIQWNPTMRYQMPIYPLMALMAAWFIFEIAGISIRGKRSSFSLKPFAVVLGIIALVYSAGWAFAFTRIYTRLHTRVEATRWIFENLPGPVNVIINPPGGQAVQQPLFFPYSALVYPGMPYDISFVARTTGILDTLTVNKVVGVSGKSGGLNFQLSITQKADSLVVGATNFSLPSPEQGSAPEAFVFFDKPVALPGGREFVLNVLPFQAVGQADLCGVVRLGIQYIDGTLGELRIDPPDVCQAGQGFIYSAPFTLPYDGTLLTVSFTHASVISQPAGPQEIQFSLISDPNDPSAFVASGKLAGDFGDSANQVLQTVKLDTPAVVEAGKVYLVRIQVLNGGPVNLYGAAPIKESSWDDPLPLRMDGYDPYGGIYQDNLNLELYWEDNSDKLNRFLDNLSKGDYILISSNRQWGTTTRVPERYPLTIKYYRELIGCPPEKEIIWCYNVAKPGDFQGNLGFELVKVFESYPDLFGLTINDQFAEEAFTVYDHPKVLIFKKTADFDIQKVREILGAVDLSKVVNIIPGQAYKYPSGAMLPRVCGAVPQVCVFFGAEELVPLSQKGYSADDLIASGAQLSQERLEANQAGGTWSKMFDYDALQNAYPAIGILLWYLSFFVLGIFTYPILRRTLPGLDDKGYPLARTAGLLIWAYLAWISSSFGVPFTRVNVALAYVIIIVVGAILAYQQRDELKEELRKKGKYFLLIEGLFLAFFLIDLFIRLGNPDLWHPAKGGERPMDFSYLNAVIKTTTFPPYDPWFAGGYINYYYYGFVLAAMPVKLLGIVPSIAYNMLLPTFFSLLAMAGFSSAWNLVAVRAAGLGEPETLAKIKRWALVAGTSTAIALVLLGNLGIPRMIYLGLARLGSPTGTLDASTRWQRLVWSVEGLGKTFTGATLPYGWGEWYWNPSRIIPAPGDVEPITEFPLFTFLYSDLHAHMISMPITLLALAWAISMLVARGRWQSRLAGLASFALGGLAIGALRPTNTWDWPTYLVIGAVATLYSFLRYKDVDTHRLPFKLSPWLVRVLYALGGVALLFVFSSLFYMPFASWYAQGYSSLAQWHGTHTPMTSYLSHWGLFLFVIVSWMTWETREWLASTPVSALKSLRPYIGLIWAAFLGLGLVLLILAIELKVNIHWLALPLAAWAAILILRPGMNDAKRAVLFLVGSGLFLTVVVEVVVLVGDLGRMNTVFKFYLQVWILFAVSAGAALAWLLPETEKWLPGWRSAWEVTGTLLLAGAAMFLLVAGGDKIRDRMALNAPRVMDSMNYMQYSQYANRNVTMNLAEDYRAIRWMQENVQGSPVIVEGNTSEYMWGTRFTIYTGLPGVVGWNWHQRQQRALFPEKWVTERVNEVGSFYMTVDLDKTRQFLDKYNVQYIIVGQLERAYYEPLGLLKFKQQDGILWNKVYEDGQTAIYKVIR